MPGWFTNHTYELPERLTPAEIRRKRLFTELTRQRKLLEVQSSRLSPATNLNYTQRVKEFQSKFGDELEVRRRRVESMRQRNLDTRSPAYKSAIARFLQLKQRQSVLLQSAAAERRARELKKSFVASRSFQSFPKTVFGTRVLIKQLVHPLHARAFHSPQIVPPCIDRLIRREVMFAKRHAGKAHRGRRRRNPLSQIRC